MYAYLTKSILNNNVGYTLPKITTCECGQKFRTYVPGKDCLLPDGNIECHQEPQLLCPDCDSGYGLHMNQDLFPHLLEVYPHHALNTCKFISLQ